MLRPFCSVVLQERAAVTELVAHAGMPQSVPAPAGSLDPHSGILAGPGCPAGLCRAAHLPLCSSHPADGLAWLQSAPCLPASCLLRHLHPDVLAPAAGELPLSASLLDDFVHCS